MHAKTRSLLVAVLVTSGIALADAWTGDRAILLGLLIAGPLLAAASLDVQRTAIVGLYAVGLAVLLGIPDGIFGTADHLLRLLGVATGAALGAFLAYRQAERDRALVRITRIAEVAQRTILRPIPPRMGRGRLGRALPVGQRGCPGRRRLLRRGRDPARPSGAGRRRQGQGPGGGAAGRAGPQQLPDGCDSCEPGRAGRRAGPQHPAAAWRGGLRHRGARRVRPARRAAAGQLRPPTAAAVSGGAVELLASAAPTTPLGLDPTPAVQRFTLASTDRLLLYTDGLMEARAPDGRQFELDGQVEAVVAASSLGAALEGLVGRLLAHVGAVWTMIWRWCWRSLACCSAGPPEPSAHRGEVDSAVLTVLEAAWSIPIG
jgi:phosphoserine phosphatase RsbU/P